MSSYKVTVKWGKELYPGVEVNTDEDPLLFKAQLFALTGVRPERQKVMLKGATLKDDDWGNMKLSNGATVLMMGTKEEDVVKEPEVKPVFVEDMSETELACSLDLPAGLHNLGNTCYMNATVQCLKSVPELREALHSYKDSINLHTGELSQSIVASMRDLLSSMDKGPAKHPIILLQMLHTAFPRFSERGTGGTFVQQDANECWTEMIRVLQQKLPSTDGQAVSKYKTFIEQYFGGKYDVEWKCTESDDEPITKTNEDFLQLSCFISQDVKYMINGLKNKMQEQVTKHSSVLGRDAVYTKTAKISRLPAYLTVQFVRFFYKENSRVNAKILKDIKFPLEFDAYDLCTPELQEKMTPMRKKFKEIEELQVSEALNADKKEKKTAPTVHADTTSKNEPYSFLDDFGSNSSGYYTLQAVLTHKGRSSSSGHYVAWVRYKDDKWIKCDDSDVTPVSVEDILKLSGGGDWHCAYVLLYGPKILKICEN